MMMFKVLVGLLIGVVIGSLGVAGCNHQQKLPIELVPSFVKNMDEGECANIHVFALRLDEERHLWILPDAKTTTKDSDWKIVKIDGKLHLYAVRDIIARTDWGDIVDWRVIQRQQLTPIQDVVVLDSIQEVNLEIAELQETARNESLVADGK